MHKWLLDHLICPASQQPLVLDETETAADGQVQTGVLRTPDGKFEYSIRGGIPRFVKTHYATAFGLQWNLHRDTQIDTREHTHSSHRFWGETGFSPDAVRGKLMLDGGCGSGRFTDIASGAGARVIAVDLSEAVDAAHKNCGGRENVAIVQASLFELPFRPGTFDFVFTIGVIQYTPDPLRALECIARMAKPGGEAGISWYKKYWYTYLHQKYLMRPLLKRLPERDLYRFVSWYVPKLLPLSRALAKVTPKKLQDHAFLDRVLPIANRDNIPGLTREEKVRWAVLDTYDWYNPAYDRPQTWRAVRKVMERAGYRCQAAPLTRAGLHCVRERVPAA